MFDTFTWLQNQSISLFYVHQILNIPLIGKGDVLSLLNIQGYPGMSRCFKIKVEFELEKYYYLSVIWWTIRKLCY